MMPALGALGIALLGARLEPVLVAVAGAGLAWGFGPRGARVVRHGHDGLQFCRG